jgi:hypothetical protein
MPEYLAPGVYVEETSFRAKSLEGVSTSTAGFVGPARYGPVSGDPELVTSFLQFQRIYGGLGDLLPGKSPQPNYLAHAVRAFFEEGGRRLFISRVFGFADDPRDDDGLWTKHYASATTGNISPPIADVALRARFPGEAGNMRVTFTMRVGANALNSNTSGGRPTLTRVSNYDVVFAGTPVKDANQRITGWTPRGGSNGDGLYVVVWDPVSEEWRLTGNGGDVALDALAAETQVRPVTVAVEVERPVAGLTATGFEAAEGFGDFGFDSRGSAGLTLTFARKPLTRDAFLTVPFAIDAPDALTIDNQEATEGERGQKTLDLARELARDRAAAVGLRLRHLRAQRRPARRVEGAGERGGALGAALRARRRFGEQEGRSTRWASTACASWPSTGRGHRVWGARTASSTPSGSTSTSAATSTTSSARSTAARSGRCSSPTASGCGPTSARPSRLPLQRVAQRRAAGHKPEEAFFVRCDRRR